MTALFAAAVLASIAFMYMNTKAELAPEEDQGVLFALTKAPQYANLDYAQAYEGELDRGFTSFPETYLRFIVNGRFGPNQGIAGVILKPWDERTRSAQQLKPLLQRKVDAVEGLRAFVFSLPPLPATIGGLPIQMVIYSPQGYQAIYEAMEKIKAAARKSGMFIVVDSDLDFNQPVIQVNIDRSKANELGITMRSIGDTLALLVGENYVNRFNLGGRSYEVIPQGPRADRLTPEALTRYYVNSAAGQPVPLSNLVTLKTATEPNALTQYNQLNSATFQAVPMPGVTTGQAIDFLELQAKSLPARLQPRLPVGFAALRARGQPAHGHFRLCPDRDLSGAGGAVRELARPAGDPRQRADVDVRGIAAAVLRLGDDEHLHPGRARHPDRPDQQARHPDGRLRQ